MSDPIRCYSTNTDIGAYYTVYMALRDHLNKNPPPAGGKGLVNYMEEFGVTSYPQLMRMTGHVRFVDAHLVGAGVAVPR